MPKVPTETANNVAYLTLSKESPLFATLSKNVGAKQKSFPMD